MRRIVRTVIATASVLLVVGALTACGSGTAPTASGSASSGTSASGSVAPSPGTSAPATTTADPGSSSGSTGLPADVAFQITATATAPNGSVAHLTETVSAAATPTTADGASLDTECEGWRTAFTSIVQRAQISTVVVSGSWPADQLVTVDLGDWSVFGGNTESFQAPCATVQLHIPGNATGVHAADAAGSDTADGWATTRYGFGYATDPSAPEGVGPNDVAISECAIVLGPAAAGSATAQAWPGNPQTFSGLGCFFGGD